MRDYFARVLYRVVEKVVDTVVEKENKVTEKVTVGSLKISPRASTVLAE